MLLKAPNKDTLLNNLTRNNHIRNNRINPTRSILPKAAILLSKPIPSNRTRNNRINRSHILSSHTPSKLMPHNLDILLKATHNSKAMLILLRARDLTRRHKVLSIISQATGLCRLQWSRPPLRSRRLLLLSGRPTTPSTVSSHSSPAASGCPSGFSTVPVLSAASRRIHNVV
eukprot:Colp12_sorted_trinity150504_noHs@7742